MGRMDGKVALITGAARGQGRSHALRLAEEGCDIIGLDICEQMETVKYGMATADNLAETTKMVENLDRRMVSTIADVRDDTALARVVREGVSEFGHIDVVLANAGIASALGTTWDITEAEWNDQIDVNLTGVWKTCKAVIPQMIDQGTGGSIIITSSIFGLRGPGTAAAYSAAKHGVVGLMRSLVNELAPHRIRVNTVHPTTVDTDMIQNDMFAEFLGVPRDQVGAVFQEMNALPVPWVEAIDISNAVLFLASEEARYITGLTLYVDAGFLTKVP